MGRTIEKETEVLCEKCDTSEPIGNMKPHLIGLLGMTLILTIMEQTTEVLYNTISFTSVIT